MSNTLESLIKLSSQKVEDKQKEIAELLSVVAQMDAREVLLKSKMVSESTIAEQSNNVQMFQAIASFIKVSQDELFDIDDARKESEKIMEKKRDDLRALYAEQKQYEILLERKLSEKKQEISRKLQNELDDIAGQRFNAD